MVVLLTGVTGVLGSEIGLALADKEEVFFLVRKESLNKVPEGMDLNNTIIGDITLPMCGISSLDMAKLKKAGVTKLLHLAADVSFTPVDKEGKIRLTNFIGTKNILDVALELDISEIHNCGTVYASTRRNPYEVSKDDAEKMVVEFCQKYGKRFSIYKPSAMVGDYTTGISYGFNGFVGASTIFHSIAQGIREKEGGFIVNLSIFFVCSTNSTMNLIPVDWVSEMFIKLYQRGAKNEVYNLAHNHPPLARWVIEEGFKNLGIIGIHYVETPLTSEQKAELYSNDRKMLRYQKWVDGVLEQFHPYCLEERQFPLETTAKALGDEFKEPPAITPEFIRRLFQHAMKVNFEAQKVQRSSAKTMAISPRHDSLLPVAVGA